MIRRLARAVGVVDPEATWRLAGEPTFDNQLATLHLDGRRSVLRIERAGPGCEAHPATPTLETTLERRLA